MTSGRPRIAMMLYGELDFDGRVKRSLSALSDRYDVHILTSGASAAVPRDYVVETLGSGHRTGLASYLAFCAAAVGRARQLRPNLVYAHDYFMCLPGLAAGRMSGAPFLYDAHELIVPDARWPFTSREKFFYSLQSLAIRKAAAVVVANRERGEVLAAHYRLPRLPTVVRNLPAAIDLPPAPKRDAMLRVVYQGVMSWERDLRPYIVAMDQLPTPLRARTKLVLIGDGPNLDEIRQFVAARQLEDQVEITGRISHAELAGRLARCDVGIVSYETHDLNTHLCAPNKLYEYAQVGLPMIASDQPPLRAAVEASGIGIVVGGDNSDADRSVAIAAAIGHIAEDLPAFRRRALAFAHDNQWEGDAERLRAAVSDALARGRSA